MKKSLMLRLLLLLVLVWGCGRDVGPVGVQPTAADLVIANCHATQKALEDFAAENGGRYPMYPADTTLAGNTLGDLLPGGDWLESPFTGSRQPVFGLAVHPGQTGYKSNIDWNAAGGLNVTGYVIIGFGDSTQVIVLTKNYPDSILAIQQLMISNSFTVRTGVERFAAENNGVYPTDVAVDRSLAGHSVIDLIGGYLENPFTGVRTEPVTATATIPGQVALAPIVHGGINSGYTITAYGRFSLIITLSNMWQDWL